MVFQLELNVDPVLFQAAQRIGADYRRIIDDWTLELADELQRLSPRGATLDLAGGWDIIPGDFAPGNPFDFNVGIVNREPTAQFRIAGRGPGRQPPVEPIRAWARAKGIPVAAAWAIARSIGQRGTMRWRTQENFLDLDRNGDLRPESFVFERLGELIEDLESIAI